MFNKDFDHYYDCMIIIERSCHVTWLRKITQFATSAFKIKLEFIQIIFLKQAKHKTWYLP